MLTEITEIAVLKTYIDELFLEPHRSAVQVAGIVSKFGMNSNHVREKVRIPLAPPVGTIPRTPRRSKLNWAGKVFSMTFQWF
jgi:hypothetical protein